MLTYTSEHRTIQTRNLNRSIYLQTVCHFFFLEHGPFILHLRPPDSLSSWALEGEVNACKDQ